MAASHSCSWNSPCDEESGDHELDDDEGQEVEFISASGPQRRGRRPLGPELGIFPRAPITTDTCAPNT